VGNREILFKVFTGKVGGRGRERKRSVISLGGGGVVGRGAGKGDPGVQGRSVGLRGRR